MQSLTTIPCAVMTRVIRVGIQLPEVEREVRWPELLDMARAIDDLGFDGIWLGEHLLYRWAGRPARGPWEAWTLMAALAAVTKTGRRSDRSSPAPDFHNPALLAKQAATIDEIAGGRFVLGLGAGWNETEFRAFGFPFDERVDRFEEAFTIIRTLLQEGAIDFDGRFYQARDCELLPRPRPGGPPLLIGSNGPRMLRITMPHAQAWNTWYADTDNTPGRRRAAPGDRRRRVPGRRARSGRDPADRRGPRPAAGRPGPDDGRHDDDRADRPARGLAGADGRRAAGLRGSRRRRGPGRPRPDRPPVDRAIRRRPAAPRR